MSDNTATLNDKVIKLYDEDSHIREFDAVVTACSFDEKRGLYAVELDQTAFFAEGGGQKSDRGILAGQTLQDVQSKLDENKKEHVFHYVKEMIEVGSSVHGSLDWDFRFDNMQQHSGEHILSGIVYAERGYHNVGFHLGEEVTTLDFDGPLTPEEVKELEWKGNQRIYRNLPIYIEYPDPETLKTIDYRSKKALEGDIRIVRVGRGEENVDCCACCAPHVKLTGEIGQIKVIRAENYKGGIRLSIVCGQRALRYFDKEHDDMLELANSMSTGTDKLAGSVAKLKADMMKLQEKMTSANKELNEYKTEKYKALAATQSSLCVFESNADQVSARNLVNALVPVFNGHVAVMIPSGDDWFFIIGSQHEDMKKLAGEMRNDLSSRGGGSAAMIQGTVKGSVEELKAYLEK